MQYTDSLIRDGARTLPNDRAKLEKKEGSVANGRAAYP